ncbi:MAG: hypothetical protein ABWJ99_06090 [Caldimicrobium sp.]
MRRKSKIFILLQEGENLLPYISYLKELQNIFNKELVFLVLKKEKIISDLIETYLIACSFAEEGAIDYAVDELKGLTSYTKKYVNELINQLKAFSFENFEILIVNKELFKEIKKLMEKEFKIELFVISPEINKEFFSRHKGIKRLVQEFSVPFITLVPKTS